jgi:hypothetical protein
VKVCFKLLNDYFEFPKDLSIVKGLGGALPLEVVAFTLNFVLEFKIFLKGSGDFLLMNFESPSMFY